MAPHLFGCRIRQDTLRVDTAAPERHLAAELFLQYPRVHIFGIDLDRVDYIETGIHQTGKNREDSPTGMFEYFPGGMLMNPVVHPFVVGKP